jgi:hypothetical protein
MQVGIGEEGLDRAASPEGREQVRPLGFGDVDPRERGASGVRDPQGRAVDRQLLGLCTDRYPARDPAVREVENGDGAAGLHEEVGAAAAAVQADLVIFVGELSRATGEGLMKAGWEGQVESMQDFEQGRAADAAALLQAGDIVLLKGSRRMKLERVIGAAQKLKTDEPRRLPVAPVRAAS